MYLSEGRKGKGFFSYEPGSPDAMIHNDHLGTPQKMTDASGTVVWAADYKPFGEVNITTNIITNNLRFSGQYYDAETGLHYNYFRDYNPLIGRYPQADPIGIMGGKNHIYAYAANSPLILIDPYGLYTYGEGAGGPVDPRTAAALTCFENCIGQPVVVTGARECGPPHVQNSAHCTGQACDLGRNNNPGLNNNNVAQCFSQCNGANGFSWGYAGGPNFHMQTRPGEGGATGFRR